MPQSPKGWATLCIMKHPSGPRTRSLRFSESVRTHPLGHEHKPEHVAPLTFFGISSPVSGNRSASRPLFRREQAESYREIISEHYRAFGSCSRKRVGRTGASERPLEALLQTTGKAGQGVSQVPAQAGQGVEQVRGTAGARLGWL